MFRDDIVWLIPAVLIALVQVKIIWPYLPSYSIQDTDIPGQYSDVHILRISYYIKLAYILFFLQLVYPILIIRNTFPITLLLRLNGYIFICIGLIISIIALKTLGKNWSGMGYYRIKKGQKLITNGIYSYIRHPIYSAVILESVGFEFVANSWLIIIVFLVGYWIIYKHVKEEDALLKMKYGSKFENYKNKTKLFIPYLF